MSASMAIERTGRVDIRALIKAVMMKKSLGRAAHPARIVGITQPETAKALALGWRQNLLHVAANVRDQPLDTRPDLLTQRAELAGTLHHDCIERAVLSRRQLELACHLLAQLAPLLWRR